MNGDTVKVIDLEEFECECKWCNEVIEAKDIAQHLEDCKERND